MTSDAFPTKSNVPWHLWAVGVVSLLWNAVGGYDYIMTKTRNTEYLAEFTPEQLEYFYSYPLLANIGWGLGVWGAILGSILLLMRSKWSVFAFIASLAGLIISLIYSFALSNGAEIMGTAGAIFMAVITIIAIALLFYSKVMSKNGVLR